MKKIRFQNSYESRFKFVRFMILFLCLVYYITFKISIYVWESICSTVNQSFIAIRSSSNTDFQFLFQNHLDFRLKMFSCNRCKNRPACAPSICVWWNWNDSLSAVLKKPLWYLPQMINGLLKMPLFIPTAPSISVSTIADVPITILSARSWFSQLSATSCVKCR